MKNISNTIVFLLILTSARLAFGQFSGIRAELPPSEGVRETNSLDSSSAELPTSVPQETASVEEPPIEQITGSSVVAVVGNEPILLSDLRNWSRGLVAEQLPVFQTKILPEQLKKIGLSLEELTTEQRQQMEREYMRNSLAQVRSKQVLMETLDQLIEVQLLLENMRRTVPEDALAQVLESTQKNFDEKIVPKVLEEKGLKTQEEMDEYYRRVEADPEAIRRIQFNVNLSYGWKFELLNKEAGSEITYNEKLKYYQEQPEEFTSTARARWEQLTVHSRGPSYRDEDMARLAKMGNAVMEGEEFSEVAKAGSEGPTAGIGGVRDWTAPGALLSSVIDRAIFTLPVGRLSPILADDEGYHIVRVTEREDAEKSPFEKVQERIRQKIEKERLEAAQERIMERLREEIPVRDDRVKYFGK